MKWILLLSVAWAAMAVTLSLDTDCVSCDFISDENPFHYCFITFSPSMQATILADCEAKSTGSEFEDWIVNIILICEVKHDIIVDPEEGCHCATCDFDYHENVFYYCYHGLSPFLQETILRDCVEQKNGPEFSDWIDNIILICYEKFHLEIEVNCACSEYTISGASLYPPFPSRVNGVYTKVPGSYCLGPNGEPYQVFQNTNIYEFYLYYHETTLGWHMGPIPCGSGAGAALLTVFQHPENAQAEWIEWDGNIWNPRNNMALECTAR